MKNRYTLPFRVKKQKDITQLLHKGMRWKCDIFAVIYLPNSLNQDRFSPLVSKKNGEAVERVSIKRVYRAVYTDCEIKNGETCYDILIRPYYGKKHTYKKVLERYFEWRSSVHKK